MNSVQTMSSLNVHTNFDRHSPSSMASTPSPSHSTTDSLLLDSDASSSPNTTSSAIVNSTPHHYYTAPPSYNNYYYNNTQCQQAYYPQEYSYNTYDHSRAYNYYHDDSAYYSSRNNSYQNTSFNEPVKQIPEVVKSKLPIKFSIDYILSDAVGSKVAVAKTEIVKPQTQSTVVNVKKRKASGVAKSAEETSANKRLRTIFTQEQLDRLEVEFAKTQYMVGSDRSQLAAEMNLSESQVKIWFQNRRIKWRRTQFGNNANNKSINHDDDENSCDE